MLTRLLKIVSKMHQNTFFTHKKNPLIFWGGYTTSPHSYTPFWWEGDTFFHVPLPSASFRPDFGYVFVFHLVVTVRRSDDSIAFSITPKFVCFFLSVCLFSVATHEPLYLA